MMSAYLILAKHPLGVIAFILLICSIISLWIYRSFWIWGSFGVLSYLVGLYAKVFDLTALAPIIILLLCYLALAENFRSFWRMFAVLTAAIVSFGLKFHLIRGFYNIPLIQNWTLSPESYPFTWYLNFDTPWIALFALAIYLPLLRKKNDVNTMLSITIPWTALTLFVILGAALWLSIVSFDPKIPLATPIWLIINLFTTVIVEEVLYRGLLQREIVMNLPNRAAPFLAILIVSLFFAFMHLTFVPSFAFFIAAFLASLMYGVIFQLTGAIESSIFTHYIVNMGHFFFFTYPSLA